MKHSPPALPKDSYYLHGSNGFAHLIPRPPGGYIIVLEEYPGWLYAHDEERAYIFKKGVWQPLE